MTRPALLALDWGTSNLRASLLDAQGQVLDHRAAPGGVMAVPDRQFAQALRSLCGDWIESHACPVIASGMIGSRQGWQEAPYLDCPAGLDQAAAQLTRIPLAAKVALHIVPGLTCVGADGEHDVMRGEETQLWGASLAPGSCCVLPGTHSKWAEIGEHGEVARFSTYMTGELYGLLTKHGILGRLMRFGEQRPEAFDAGVRLGLDQHANATHVIFAARTAGLMNKLEPEALPDYLSGLLIGIEIGGALRHADRTAVTLLGDDELCNRYASALRIADVASTRAADGATTHGQWLVAQRAGLLESAR